MTSEYKEEIRVDVLEVLSNCADTKAEVASYAIALDAMLDKETEEVDIYKWLKATTERLYKGE